MSLDRVIAVFQEMDKDLKTMLTEEEFGDHVRWRALEFWTIYNAQCTFYHEFMEK